LIVKAAWIDQERVIQILRDIRREYAVRGPELKAAWAARHSRPVASPAEARITMALDSETRLEFPYTPLRDAVQFLGQLHDVNV
jgi:hypothetical protein